MKNLKVVLGALSMLTLGSANAGTLVLDSFNYSPGLELTVNSGSTGAATATVASLETPGAMAAYSLEYTSITSGTAGASANVQFESDGRLSYDENDSGDGELNILYSIPTGPGVNDFVALDMSGYSSVYFDVLFIDANGGFSVELTLVDSDGTTISGTYAVTSTGTFLASFASLMPTADFDFSQVKSLNALITSPGTANDFSLGSVGLVPEPSALAILGLGLIGLGLRRRKLV